MGNADNIQGINVAGRVRGNNSEENNGRCAHRWSNREVAALIASLVDIFNIGWKQDNGNFRAGYQLELERLMKQKIVDCQLKAQPHIDSKVRWFRKHYFAVADMKRASGFGWNDIEKFVTCEDVVWENYIKSHPVASKLKLRNTPFPYFDELDYVYGKDRATGEGAENPADAVEDINMEDVYEDSYPSEINSSQMHTEHKETQHAARQSSHATDIPSSSTTKKKRKNETVEVAKALSGHMDTLTTIMAAVGERIGQLADCFKHESESATRRQQLVAELQKLDLDQADLIKTIQKIGVDPLQTDLVFTMDPELRKAYVLSLLIPDHL